MKISYNIDHLPERGRPYAAKSEETLALIAFLADLVTAGKVVIMQ